MMLGFAYGVFICLFVINSATALSGRKFPGWQGFRYLLIYNHILYLLCHFPFWKAKVEPVLECCWCRHLGQASQVFGLFFPRFIFVINQSDSTTWKSNIMGGMAIY